MYRLAHFLEALTTAAYSAISRSLDGKNLAKELFGSLPKAYPDLLTLLVGNAADQWESVAASKGMRAVRARMANGEGDAADAGIVMKLLSQLEIKGYLSRCGGTLRD